MKIYPQKKDIFYLNYPNLLNINSEEKNKVIFFSGTDSESNFNNNLKKMPYNWHYREKEVNYKINDSGYRTDDWLKIDWKNSIVIFGCSCVFGVGLAEDEIISHYLQQMTGIKVINMGYGAGSNDLMVDNCASMINNFGYPMAVIFGWTFPDRFLFFSEKNHINVGNWILKQDLSGFIGNRDQNIYKNIYKYRRKNGYNLQMIGHNHKKIIMAMLKDKTKFIDFCFFEMFSNIFDCDHIKEGYIFNPDFNDEFKARDLCHPGRYDNYKIAEYLYKKIKQ